MKIIFFFPISSWTILPPINKTLHISIYFPETPCGLINKSEDWEIFMFIHLKIVSWLKLYNGSCKVAAVIAKDER